MWEDTRRLIIVPRWGGRPDADFYPWLLARLSSEHAELFSQVQVLDLPKPELPDVKTWPAAISTVLGTEPSRLENTYVLAHSVGCQALMRSLFELPDETRIGGALCVAGWWEIDRPWDSIRPWLAPLQKLSRIRTAMKKLRVLLSDNDPFTADHVRNSKQWQDLLGAQVQLEPGGKHFNAAEEPAVLAALLTLLAPGSSS